MEALAPVRHSHLKLMALSPAHYFAAVRKETQSLERGSSVHSILLGGQEVLPYLGKVRRGKEYDAFCAEHPDALVITLTDYDKVMGMVDAVRASRAAMELLAGQHEVEVNWSYLGRACRSTIDVIGGGGAWITELKTAVSSEPERFRWQAHRMGYFSQLAFYLHALDDAPKDAYIVAVESSAPYVVTVMHAAEDALEMGRRTVRLWFERLLGCEAANDWPGYVQGVVDLHAPEKDIEFTYGEPEPPHDPVTGEVAA